MPSSSVDRLVYNCISVSYSRVYRPSRHIIGHLGDDFTGHITQPTES